MQVNRVRCLGIVLLVVTVTGAGVRAAPREPVPEERLMRVIAEIRAEAARKTTDPAGKPLPLVAHWNRGSKPTGFSPDYQLELIRAGYHVMPWFEFPRPDSTPDTDGYFKQYIDAFKQVAEWKLPFTLVGTQWEMILGKKGYAGGPYPWKELPPDQNPLVIDLEGNVAPKRGISPFGPVKPWQEAARVWVESGTLKHLQELYPDPPLVIFLSNNEAHKLRWKKHGDIETISRRYLDKYGAGRDDEFKRSVVGDGWLERYTAFHEAMRDGLQADAWKENVRFVGYGAFGPLHMGRWGEWPVYSLYRKGRFDWAPYAWDGCSPSYYTHNWDASTDFRVHGPPISFMNGVMIQRQVYRDRPDYWFEFSVWDGNQPKQENDKWAFYEKHGEPYTPIRHGSYVEFGMWLTRPRLVRPWRSYIDTRERVGEYFEAVVKVVDRIHTEPTLARFWREGTLVANTAHEHPYQVDFPAELKDEERWYLLDTNLDPPRPWEMTTELPVFSLAYVIGGPDEGQREWLLYARSPLADRESVEITIPGYKSVIVDVPIAGAFHHVTEKGGGVARAAVAD